MSTINDLSVTGTVSSDDKIPVWQNANGVTRGLPISVLDSRYLTAADVAALAASPTTERFISDILPNPTGLPTFTAGSTIALTLANQYFSAANVEVFFDTGYQGIEQYSLVGYGLAFTSAIPVGVQNIYVRGGSVRVVGTPGQETITDGMVAPGTDLHNRLADEISVTDFPGADPSGAQDSTGAFNAAASASVTLGKTVYVPGGLWKIGGTFVPGSASWRHSPNATYTGTWPNYGRGFFTNINTPQFPNGAAVHRMTDRVMVGTAARYDGSNAPVYPASIDWIGNTYPVFGGTNGAFEYLLTNATFAVGAAFGQGGITSYARASDSPFGGGMIAFASAVVNDSTLTTPNLGVNTWNYYGTGVRTATATGNVVGFELDVCNLGTTVPIFPNNMFAQGQTVVYGACAGGELQDAAVVMGVTSAAYTIASNDAKGNAKFEKGIVFHSAALLKTNGIGVAMALGQGHAINWYDGSNFQMNSVFSTATTGSTNNAQSIQFSDFGLLVTNSSGQSQFRVANNVPNSSNYLMVTSAAPGTAPSFSAQGSDTNIDLALVPQAAGNVRFGTYTAGAVTQAGYITIKDSGGTVRRLLVG